MYSPRLSILGNTVLVIAGLTGGGDKLTPLKCLLQLDAATGKWKETRIVTDMSAPFVAFSASRDVAAWCAPDKVETKLGNDADDGRVGRLLENDVDGLVDVHRGLGLPA